jgi:hypothetical protein
MPQSTSIPTRSVTTVGLNILLIRLNRGIIDRLTFLVEVHRLYVTGSPTLGELADRYATIITDLRTTKAPPRLISLVEEVLIR